VKVLFVLEYHYPHVGGVETLFKDLTENLVNHSYEVTVLTNLYDDELPRAEILNGVNIIRVPFKNRYLFTLLAFFPAFRLARKHDFIHSTSYNAAIPAFFAGFLARRRVFITFHEVWGSLWFKLPYMSRISKYLHFTFEWFLLKLPFYRFIAVSESTKSGLINHGINPQKVKMIYNGIDYQEFKAYQNQNQNQKSTETFRFIYFGRLGISKGLDVLIDGAALCKLSGASFALHMVIPSENTSFKNKILTAIKDNDIEDRVIIHHDLKRADLLALISSSDATIIPSYSEGFGFTAVESIAIDIPVISSGLGSLPEVVSGDHIYFSPYNGQGLADSMNHALEGKWQHTPKKEFTLEDSVSQYVDLYQSIDN